MEVPLQVSLGGRAAEHESVGVNEGEILALLVGEAMGACAADAA